MQSYGTSIEIDKLLTRLTALLRTMAEVGGGTEAYIQIIERLGQAFIKTENSIGAFTNFITELNKVEEKLKVFKQETHKAFSPDVLDGMISTVRILKEEMVGVAKAMNSIGASQGDVPLASGGGIGTKPDSVVSRSSIAPALRSEARLQELLTSKYISGKVALERLKSVLSSYRMGLQNLSSVTQEATTGTTRFTATQVDADGNSRMLTASVDRLGKVTTEVSGRFKNLGQQISGSVLHFAKLTLAMMTVYGVVNLVNEALRLTVENQEELATISIALGENEKMLANAFEAVADAAELTGESLDGVLKGYSQAIRAAGSYTSEIERITKANQLLEDSLILSKLSTLDQAKAMDTLVAAVAQSGLNIDEGIILLNRWVAVSKIANVDMRTLAESYAIVGNTAKSAGIQVGGAKDELSGLIAVLAEGTILSGTETGNALRAVISGMNTDAAAKELRKYGISVRDVNGELLGFMDTAKRIASMLSTEGGAGIINDKQLAAIARAIGGGVRRQVQVETVLRGLARAQTINTQASGTQAEAQRALEIQTATLRTALTRLSNSFQELAMTLGTEGGILSITTDLIELFTLLVKGIEGVGNAIGKNAPALMALGGLALYGKVRKVDMFSSLGVLGFGSRAMGGVGLGEAAPSPSAARMSGRAGAGVFGGALMVGIPALLNLLEGKKKEAAFNVGGGIAGGAIGSFFGPMGTVIGASIGSSIGEAFVNTVLEFSGDIGAAIWEAGKDRVTPLPGEPPLVEEDLRAESERAILQALGAETTGGRFGGRFDILAGEFEVAMKQGIYNILLWGQEKGFTNMPGILPAGMDDADIAAEALRIQNRSLLDILRDPFAPDFAGTTGANQEWQHGRDIIAYNEQFGPAIKDKQKEMLDDLVSQLTSGDLSGQAVTTKRGTIRGLAASISQLLAAQATDGQVQIGGETFGVEEGWKEYAEIIVGATIQQQDIINQYMTSIQLLSQGIEGAIQAGKTKLPSDEEGAEGPSLEEAREEQFRFIQELSAFMGTLSIQQAYDKYDRPGIINLGDVEVTPEIEAEIRELGAAIQAAYEQAILGGNEKVIAQFRAGIGQTTLQSQGTIYTDLGDEIASNFLNQAIGISGREGLLKDASKATKRGFLELPFEQDSAERRSILGGEGYQSLLKILTENLDYTSDISKTIAIFSGKEMEKIELDNTIIQMLLGDIVDNTQQIVDGIYNIPGDGSFFVDVRSLQASYANRSSGGFSQGDLINQYTAGEKPIEEFKVLTQLSQIFGESLMGPFQGVNQADEIARRTSDNLSSQPISVRIEFEASLKVNLDGRELASVIKRFIQTDIRGKRGISGGAIRLAI